MIAYTSNKLIADKIEQLSATSVGLPKEGCETLTNGICVKKFDEDRWAFVLNSEFHSNELIKSISNIEGVTMTDDVLIPSNFFKSLSK
jgi:hypothetical protein